MSNGQLLPAREIEDRLKRRYLDRLAERLKRMRKNLVDRSWSELKSECRQIRLNGEDFGFNELVSLATALEGNIPEGEISRSKPLPEAKIAAEDLLAAVEVVLQSRG